MIVWAAIPADDPGKTGSYWVYDEDGWAYWAQPIDTNNDGKADADMFGICNKPTVTNMDLYTGSEHMLIDNNSCKPADSRAYWLRSAINSTHAALLDSAGGLTPCQPPPDFGGGFVGSASASKDTSTA